MKEHNGSTVCTRLHDQHTEEIRLYCRVQMALYFSALQESPPSSLVFALIKTNI